MEIYIWCARKGLQIRIGLQNQKHYAIKSTIKSSFFGMDVKSRCIPPKRNAIRILQSCSRNPADACPYPTSHRPVIVRMAKRALIQQKTRRQLQPDIVIFYIHWQNLMRIDEICIHEKFKSIHEEESRQNLYITCISFCWTFTINPTISFQIFEGFPMPNHF